VDKVSHIKGNRSPIYSIGKKKFKKFPNFFVKNENTGLYRVNQHPHWNLHLTLGTRMIFALDETHTNQCWPVIDFFQYPMG
jgi:hypothetical protein